MYHRKLNLIRRRTVRDKSMRVKIDIRLDDKRINFALVIAMSLPLPIAIPTSADQLVNIENKLEDCIPVANAGASLMPSPIIATMFL